jgi:hypothetical protein
MSVEEFELLKKFILTRLTSSDKIFYTKRDDNGKKHHLYRKEGHLYYEIENGLAKYEEQVIDVSNKDILEDFVIENQKVIIQKIKELETNLKNLLNNPLLITHSFDIEKNMKKIYETSQGSKKISLYYNTLTDELLYKIGSSNINPLPIVLTIIDTIYTLETLYGCNIFLTDMIFDRTPDIFNRTTAKLDIRGGKRIATAAPAYKLNGEKVSLLINKKKLHRSVYVKSNGNGNGKYCKINNEFVLLSKLKNKIIE